MQLFQRRSVLKIFESKFFLWTVIPSFVLGAFIFIYFSSVKDLTVFPNHDRFHYSFYTDSVIGGNSKIIHWVVKDSIIQIDFILNNGIKDPYIGLSITPTHDPIIELAHYNQLDIKVRGININNMGMALFTTNTYTAIAKQSPEMFFYATINISSTINTYANNFNQFKVPDWWLEMYNPSNAARKIPELKNISRLTIGNGFTPNKGEKQSLEIYSITFTRNNKPLLILLLLLELGVILIAFIIIYTVEKIRGYKKSITIRYESVKNDAAIVPKTDFIDFINKNFHNNQLTLDYIWKETGVSQRKITIEIQKRFDCNLKTYINRLRMSESKRLLIETNLPIVEISYKVGFNNQTHFNRVFKAEMQISPSEYRNRKNK